MPYRSDLEARIAKRATQAITEFNLIEDGDHVLVALSGGKDSWALLQILEELRRRAPIRFTLAAVNVDAGQAGYRHDVVAAECERRGWPCRVVHTRIADVMGGLLEPGKTPCSLCARLRRGVLYRVAAEEGATKIALGHHADDCLETLLLNLFFAGSLKAMPARLVSDKDGHVVIRPLVYVAEADTNAYARACGFPIVDCCCPACDDPSMKRQRVKRLILDLEREHPGVKASMLTALTRVVGSHLLDPALHPAAGRPGPGERTTPPRAPDGAAGSGEEEP